MSDGKYINLKTCAVTGARYEAGDYVVKADFGIYVVKASVDYTPELRAATEKQLRETLSVAATEEYLAPKRARRSEPVEPPAESIDA